MGKEHRALADTDNLAEMRTGKVLGRISLRGSSVHLASVTLSLKIHETSRHRHEERVLKQEEGVTCEFKKSSGR